MKNYFTEQELLQNYGILFENLKKQQIIKQTLAEYGYDEAEVQKGEQLYTLAKEKYQQNIKEGQEEVTAHANFKHAMDELTKTYAIDRKKARIIYKDNPDVRRNLRLSIRTSTAIATVLDDIQVFYTSLNQDADLLAPLQKLKITPEHVSQQLTKLQQVQKHYSDYTNEKGENQDATKQKNKAIKELEAWVREFYSIAKIALEDQPQLLESVAKFIRS